MSFTTLVEVQYGEQADTTAFFVDNIIRLRLERVDGNVVLIDARPHDRLIPDTVDFSLVETFENRRLLFAKALELIAAAIRAGKLKI